MGAPKSRLAREGVTLLERAWGVLRSVAQRVVVIGDDGEPRDLAETVWLDDPPGVRGPLAGILAAFGYEPAADWLVVGCDMPAFDRRALDWLLDNHDARLDATLALLPGRANPEPLLAVYTPSGAAKLETPAKSRSFAMHRALAALDARIVSVPPDLAGQWRNVNTPEQWQEYLADS